MKKQNTARKYEPPFEPSRYEVKVENQIKAGQDRLFVQEFARNK